MPPTKNNSFKIHSLVWGKRRGFPLWPGIVVEKPKYMPPVPNIDKDKGKHYCLYLFGSREYAWCHNVVAYELLSKNDIKKKAKGFKKACKEVEQFIVTRDANLITPRVDYNIRPRNTKTKTKSETSKKTKSHKKPSIPVNPGPSRHKYTEDFDLSLPLTIGIIGLSSIGTALAENLLRANYRIVIWSKYFGNPEPFLSAGATLVQTPTELARSVDVIFSCVQYNQLRPVKSIFFNEVTGVTSDIKKDLVYVEMSTIDSNFFNGLQEEVLNCCGRYIKCVALYDTKNVELEDLTLLCTYDEQAYNALNPVFDAISIFHRHVDELLLNYLLQEPKTLKALIMPEVSDDDSDLCGELDLYSD